MHGNINKIDVAIIWCHVARGWTALKGWRKRKRRKTFLVAVIYLSVLGYIQGKHICMWLWSTYCPFYLQSVSALWIKMTDPSLWGGLATKEQSISQKGSLMCYIIALLLVFQRIKSNFFERTDSCERTQLTWYSIPLKWCWAV